MIEGKDTQRGDRCQEDEVRILMIEGVVVGDEVKIRYNLPPVNSPAMKEFYKSFIIQLCEAIADLEGAEGLFDIVEDEDDG